MKLRLVQPFTLAKAPAGAPLINRGYLPSYRSDEINRCPGCGRTHWHIGRVLAECAFCATALPLAECVK
jgi:hypothetical protein